MIKKRKKKSVEEEINKAKEIMILWEIIETKIIKQFCSDIDEEIIKEFAAKCAGDEYLQMFGELLQTLGNMTTLFSQHQGIALQAIGLIETFSGNTKEKKERKLK